ncbi:MAG: biotin--[acetyl-CoA-carboxylase] ligase [Microcystaceae cyanobacterium]
MTITQFKEIPIYYFDQITSTNQLLWQYLEQGKKAPMVAIAAQQTAGRGQWGRIWQSELGGLYLSLILPLNLSADSAPHLTLLSGVGIAQILRNYQIPVQLKWPNDLILNQRKLGGIKTETRVKKGQLTYAVIGVGINWENPVPSVGIALKSYLEEQSLRSISSLNELAILTVEGLTNSYQRYQNEGINPILSDYWQLFAYRDQYIEIEGNKAQIIGITTKGELTVRCVSLGGKTQLNLVPGSFSLGYSSQ